jgi:hypothetical protein
VENGAMTSTDADTHNAARDSFKSFHGKRFSVSGNDFDDSCSEDNDEESITPITEIRQFEAGGNGDSDDNGEGVRGESDDNNDKNNNNKKVELAFKKAEEVARPLFKDQYGVCYGWLDTSGHKEVIKIESGKFKRLLVRVYYDNVGTIPKQSTIDSWAQMFHAFADFEGTTHPLSLRVAWYDNSIYYDLTNDSWSGVKITPQGWQVEDKTPIPMFTRYNQTAQVTPLREYPADIFDQLLSLTNLKHIDDKLLLMVYIVTLFIPDIPHAMLVLHGEKGSAKSTLQTLIKLLVDPAKPRLLTVYKDLKEFIQQLAHNHVAFYDNLKHTPQWLSDEACKAVTGVGSTKRKLYSDDDDVVYEYMRCLGFNGINISLTEPDALDRSLMIELERIKRENARQENEIMEEFYRLRPFLLSYIFDVLSKALAIKPTMILEDLPRMADFAIWGESISRAMGYSEMEFIEAYYENIGKQNTEAVESDPLGQARTIFERDNRYYGYNEETPTCWTARTSSFLDILNSIAGENHINTDYNSWPRTADALTKRLKVISSNLREGLGVNISVNKIRTGAKRGLSITRVWKNALHASAPYQTTFDTQFSRGNEDNNPSEQTEVNLG